MAKQHISIFGGGSVGLCLAINFAKAGARVTLLVREKSIAGMEGKPFRMEGMMGDHEVPAGEIALCDAAHPSDDVLGSDMLIVTTKAQDFASELAPFAGERCPPLLLLQNGWGNAEVAREAVGPSVPVYPIAMMIGMHRSAPTEVKITAQASPINCGALLGDAEAPLLALLATAERGFVPMAHDPAIRDTIAYKLLFNSCLKPTGAITGQTYGELLTNPNSRALVTGLADETLAAYAACWGYRPADSGAAFVDGPMSKIVFPRSAPHKSSMFQDFQAGRRTEIDVLNGAVVKLAHDAGLDAPRHKSIIQLVKACETAAEG